VVGDCARAPDKKKLAKLILNYCYNIIMGVDIWQVLMNILRMN
jgi:hypothetical protein